MPENMENSALATVKSCCHKLCAMPGFRTSRGEDFDLGTETSLDHWSFLCNRILFKYKREKASDVDIRRGTESACPVPHFCALVWPVFTLIISSAVVIIQPNLSKF